MAQTQAPHSTAADAPPAAIDATKVMMRAGFEQGAPDPEMLMVAFRTVRSIVAPSEPWTAPVRRLLDAVSGLAGTSIDIDSVEPITFERTAEAIPYGPLRVQLVRLSIVAVLCGGLPSRDAAARVKDLAEVLRVDEPGVGDLELLARHHRLRMRINMTRRFWPFPQLRRRIQARGWGEVVNTILSMLHLYEDEEITARYRPLAGLTPDSLGVRFHGYLEDNEFPIPGQRGATSELIVHHDLVHVLSGYDTSPLGETQAICFAAGYRRVNPFSMVLYVLCQFHLGVRVAVARGSHAHAGHFDPVLSLEAIRRAANMTIDPDGEWDYWTVMHESVDELRLRYNIKPLATEIADRVPLRAWGV